MADSNMLSLKHTSSSLFNIPGFFIGFGNKRSSDSCVRSPTLPLDFRVHYQLSNPFSLRSPRSSSQNKNQKKWDCSKEGLSIVNSLVDETKTASEVGSPKRKNIIFGLQVKTNIPNSSKLYYDSDNDPVQPKTLDRNYILRPFSEAVTVNSQLQADRGNDLFGSVELPFKSEPSEGIASSVLDSNQPSSPVGSVSDPNLRFKILHSENKTLMSSSVALGNGLQVESSLGFKPSSLPVPIASISAREIELSEDYTCIICHGPKPKTTHIFGDCILECHTNEVTNFDREKPRIESPRVAQYEGGLESNDLNGTLRFCYACKKSSDGDEIDMCSENAFCSLDCHSEKIFSEEETKSTYDNSAGNSPESYHEDVFLLGMDCQDIE